MVSDNISHGSVLAHHVTLLLKTIPPIGRENADQIYTFRLVLYSVSFEGDGYAVACSRVSQEKLAFTVPGW